MRVPTQTPSGSIWHIKGLDRPSSSCQLSLHLEVKKDNWPCDTVDTLSGRNDTISVRAFSRGYLEYRNDVDHCEPDTCACGNAQSKHCNGGQYWETRESLPTLRFKETSWVRSRCYEVSDDTVHIIAYECFCPSPLSQGYDKIMLRAESPTVHGSPQFRPHLYIVMYIVRGNVLGSITRGCFRYWCDEHQGEIEQGSILEG